MRKSLLFFRAFLVLAMQKKNRSRLSGRLFFALCAASAFALSGCSGLSEFMSAGDPMAPEKGKLLMTLKASGEQQFQCTADKKGRWWKFIAPDAVLVDEKGRIIARQEPDFIFRASDGSVLSAKIVKWDTHPKSHNNLRDVLFETRAQGKKKGVLTGIRWVSRTEGAGGQPQTRCSPSQIGTTLKVPFTAVYRFYQ